MPTLKGTEALLSYVQWFLYLLQQMSLFFILCSWILLDRPCTKSNIFRKVAEKEFKTYERPCVVLLAVYT